MLRLTPIALAVALAAAPVAAQDTPPLEPPMTLGRMAEIIFALDEDALNQGTRFRMSVSDIPVLIITDPVADRMRAMVPIRQASDMSREELERVMQANFDTALDARYAIANGQLWATYIHPLSPLEKDQLISAIGQAVNLARTYGTLYSGGAMTFGGGDSNELHRQLIDKLLEKGQEI